MFVNVKFNRHFEEDEVGHTYNIAAHIMGILIHEGCNYHLLIIHF